MKSFVSTCDTHNNIMSQEIFMYCISFWVCVSLDKCTSTQKYNWNIAEDVLRGKCLIRDNIEKILLCDNCLICAMSQMTNTALMLNSCFVTEAWYRTRSWVNYRHSLRLTLTSGPFRHHIWILYSETNVKQSHNSLRAFNELIPSPPPPPPSPPPPPPPC